MVKIEGTNDPAAWMIDHPSIPRTPVTVYRDWCYICTDGEFARMGLPLCKSCPACSTGHVPADDECCDDCGASLREFYIRRERKASTRGAVLASLRARREMAEYHARRRQARRTSSRVAVRRSRLLWVSEV